MPDFTAVAPGKIILFGEHAVVYGKPAIAVPVTQVRARASVQAAIKAEPGSVWFNAPEIAFQAELSTLDEKNPLAFAVRLVLAHYKIARSPACKIKISSTIPVAAGLGSGAAVSIALMRAYAAFLGRPLTDEAVCGLAYEVEKLHHGTPSGIDNTVIAFSLPIFYVRGQPVKTFQSRRPFSIVIADTGVASPTAVSVGDVRKNWQTQQALYENYFESIGSLVESARQMIEFGLVETLGPLMDANHGILRKIGVSSPELERLVEAARSAGALGAKLSGGGRGGNMIALVTPASSERVADALRRAGAVRTLVTEVK